jgi:hypothetical protein
MVARPYTPISSDDDLGRLDLLIKVVRCHRKFMVCHAIRPDS